ncbi:MAG TPA: wax ester/triacylglycerol synthase family O-acyltransferase [Xanthomonadaceae bacterium]|nr:wax ester/triacylglycerol synthase family O-acyltransferase [Xanthomonadaceae bacterium]
MAESEQRGAEREAMAKVDTAWLRMESPTNLMMITGVMMFEKHLDLRRLRKLIRERFLAFRRFRQRAVDTQTGAFWEDAEPDLDWHVQKVALPAPAGQAELEALASELASTALDHERPLWHFLVVDRYQGGSALVVRIHHCYADGIALVQVLLSLTDTAPTSRKEHHLPRKWLKKDGRTVFDRLLAPARAGFDQAMQWGGKLVDFGGAVVRDPSLAKVVATEGVHIARELAHVIALSDDPPTRYRAPLCEKKRVAWAEPMPLDEVKAIGRAYGCTVNDVLLAAAAGALRGCLRDWGDDPDGLTIRATVPVNLRPLEHAKKLGNHFGLVFLDLPIGEANPVSRLYRVAASMRELKASRQAIVAYGLLGALGMGPLMLQRPALELFSRKATTVATNVPGPQMPLYLAGVKVIEQMFWVPQSGSIGMGLSILSYNGRVHFGVITDSRCVPEPRCIVERFRPELDKLVYVAMLEDWEQPISAEHAALWLDRLPPQPPQQPRQRRRAHRNRAMSS